MKHYGDITKINGAAVEPVDILTGGSPCQDLSVAGKRAGLAGERSGLFMEQIRIVKEMRENDRANGRTNEFIRPRFMVWENVPGAFSSNKGADFQAVLTEIVRVVKADAPDVPLPKDGKWSKSGCVMGYGDDGQPFSICYRLHDAQFWGVPQRRKRIALVADFGGVSAPEILFERKGVSGNPEQSDEEGEETSRTVGESTSSTSYTLKIRGGVERDSSGKKAGKGALIQTELSATLGVSQDQTLIKTEDKKDQVSVLNDQGGGVMNTSEDVTGSLRAEEHGHQPIVYGLSSDASNAMRSSNPNSGIYQANTSRTLDNNGGNPACNQGGMIVLEGNGQRDSHRGDGYTESEQMYTLNTVEQHAVCYDLDGERRRGIEKAEEVSPTLSSHAGTGGNNLPAVCYSTQASGDRDNPSQSFQEEVAYTVPSNPMSDRGQAVCYGLDRASFNQGINAQFDFQVDEELAQTLMSRGPGGVLTK